MAYADSATASAVLTLEGMWVHDPADPEGTVHNYPYSKSSRSSTVDLLSEGTYFVGRTYPVMDYGEHQNDTFSVRIDIPNGTDWFGDLGTLQSFALSRTTLCFRDGRGRVFFGGMSGFSESDEDWGTQVSFSVSRVDFEESV